MRRYRTGWRRRSVGVGGGGGIEGLEGGVAFPGGAAAARGVDS